MGSEQLAIVAVKHCTREDGPIAECVSYYPLVLIKSYDTLALTGEISDYYLIASHSALYDWRVRL